MKFIISTILIAALAFGLTYVLPWWGFVVGAFIIGAAMNMKGGSSFLSGLLAIALLFGIYSYMLDQENASLLSSKVATMISLPNSIALIIVSALIAGIAGGLGAWSGSQGRKLLG